MPSNRKKHKLLSLPELLLKVYEQGHSTAEFGETQNQIKALE